MPIPFAQVLLTPDGETNIVAFTQSDSRGEYSLKVNKWGNFMLEYRAISFQSRVYPVTILESQREHEMVINPILNHQSVSINEVVVMGERPITLKRDTVIFRISSFAKGDEQVAEDILKHLPGITVSEGGGISWQGKEVEKLMIEGDDLFGKGYRLVSRNLPSGIIDKVEVYERYSHNSLLKDIEYSNRVALNLTLKEDVRLTLFGNGSVGYSSHLTHTVSGSVMSVGKKNKYYLFTNSNSVGVNPTGDIRHFVNPQIGDEQDSYQQSIVPINYLINIKGFAPNLREQRVRDNNSNMLSVNTIIKPAKKLTAKLVTFGTHELDAYFNEGYMEYRLANSNFTNTESHNLLNRAISGFGRIDLKYDYSKNSNLEYQGQVMRQIGKSTARHTFNLVSNEELLSNSTTTTSHSAVFTHRKNSSMAIVAVGQFFIDERPERYYVSAFTLGDLFQNISDGTGQWQSVKSSMNTAKTELKALFRLGEKYVFNVQSGSLLQWNRLFSLFTIDQSSGASVTPPLGYSNNVRLFCADTYIVSSITRVVKTLSLNAKVGAHWMHTVGKGFAISPFTQSQPLIEPQVGGQWQPNSKNKIKVQYIYKTSPSSMAELMNGFVLTGARSFKNGIGQFLLQKAHTSMFRYDFGRVSDIFQMNVSTLYTTSKKAFSSFVQITPSYSLQSIMPSSHKEMLITSAATDFYIRSLRSNFRVKGNIVSSRFISSINGSVANITSQNYNYGGELRSAFKGFFNYHVGTNWSYSRFISSITTSNNNNFQFLDLHFKLSPSFQATINAERYYFDNIRNPNNPLHFIDGSITYTHKPKKLTFTAIANNLLNNKQFGNISITEYSEIGSFYRIVPRYIMLRVDFRF